VGSLKFRSASFFIGKDAKIDVRRRPAARRLTRLSRVLQTFQKETPMTIQRIDAGPRMSKAVVNGNTVYLAGIVADAPKGKSMGEQTKSILAQIDGFLAQAGTDKSKLLSANIWITDMAKFGEMNAVWDAWVSPGNTPARATVEAKLASPDYLVEIMVVAAK
jgi:enamine deaminase RidA (YjgF/YER057c/UK114 family)